MSVAVTREVQVEVASVYVPEQSTPEEGLYFFAYQVRITNRSQETVQLVTRHWIITDGDGRTDEVKGPGVVGETPILKPGESFSYVSGCPLRTPVGTMHGTYQMVYPNEERPGFDAQIAPFQLAFPNAVH
ncbi:MAG: Co2+/Mg2+ efflux protein ApaG [Myxococcales bacterium]|nr:Co2+/Mg2+ efflux protein ApaG [Myxococcales bacterium]MCB9734284.1 Co2+/Mg2+ efflux protein ApaG [Deltaproteobacteria bacterium]